MKTSTPEKVIYGITLMALVWFVLLFIWSPVYASGDCKGNQPCNGDTNVNIGDTRIGATTVTTGDTIVTPGDTLVTTGDTSMTSNSKALALSNSLGDVDISACLGSVQWATPLFSKQKLVVNWPCLTEFDLRNAQFDLAAMAICNTEIRKEFASEQECRDAHDFQQMLEEPVMVMESDDDEVEYLRDVLEEQALLQADLNAKIQNLERSNRVVIQQPYLSDEKKQKLREIVDE